MGRLLHRCGRSRGAGGDGAHGPRVDGPRSRARRPDPVALRARCRDGRHSGRRPRRLTPTEAWSVLDRIAPADPVGQSRGLANVAYVPFVRFRLCNVLHSEQAGGGLQTHGCRGQPFTEADGSSTDARASLAIQILPELPGCRRSACLRRRVGSLHPVGPSGVESSSARSSPKEGRGSRLASGAVWLGQTDYR